jgi:hypothetical protein
MSNEEFQKLSTAEKIAYLNKAVAALKNGEAMVTPNGPFEDYKE